MERARAMLAGSRGIVLGDLFPRVLEILTPDLARAAARGVRVTVKAYAPAAIPDVEILSQPDVTRPLGIWPGQQLSLVADAEEHLLALFDDRLDTVHQAVWSRSTFLSCLHHNHLAMEHLVTLYTEQREKSLPAADHAFQNHMNLTVLYARPAGLDRLRSRYGTVSPSKESSS
jgi:hypothetical protein